MNNRGQNIIEYVLIVAVVIVILIAFLGPTGIFRSTMDDTLNVTMVVPLHNLATSPLGLNTDLIY